MKLTVSSKYLIASYGVSSCAVQSVFPSNVSTGHGENWCSMFAIQFSGSFVRLKTNIDGQWYGNLPSHSKEFNRNYIVTAEFDNSPLIHCLVPCNCCINWIRAMGVCDKTQPRSDCYLICTIENEEIIKCHGILSKKIFDQTSWEETYV